jgi:hypothetical protein
VQKKAHRPKTWCPTLTSLGLDQEQIAALSHQGFVSSEQSNQGPVRFKLRFRNGRRQVVRYIGTDNNFAEQVRCELDKLQERVRSQRQLNRQCREIRRRLRTIKRRTASVLTDIGHVYHGLSLRQPREARS